MCKNGWKHKNVGKVQGEKLRRRKRMGCLKTRALHFYSDPMRAGKKSQCWKVENPQRKAA